MKKILIVMDDINYKGGAHEATFKIANFLVSEENLVDIYSPHEVDKDTKKKIKDEVVLVTEKKFEGYDYVIVPFENSIFRQEVASLKNIVKIQWVHIEYERWRNILNIDIEKERNIYTAFDKVVFVSEHNKNSFLNVFPEFSAKCQVIYNFIDDISICEKSLELIDEEIMQKTVPEQLNIVVSGRLEPQKAYHRLIDVVKILNEKSLQTEWYILGKGYEYEELKARCEKYAIKNIHFLGFRENPYAFVSRADLFAILSEYEGLALVVAESLVLGVPVLSTESGGVREMLLDDYGWIVENDIYSIIHKLEEIYNDRQRLYSKRENLKTYQYNNKMIEERILELFDKRNEGIRKMPIEKKALCKEFTNPKVSIIVPVYNMEKYLVECLESLVNQTLKEIEIIIVNDGSTDRSIDIINDYVYKYSDIIRAFTISNGGLGEARNYGIAKAKGQFLGFVDSDDTVRHDMFEIMYNAAIQNNADCILSDYIATWATGKTEYVTSAVGNAPDRFDILKYSAKYGVVNACTKLVEKSLFDKVKFPKGFYEDLATMPIILSYAKKIYYVQQGLYYYRQRSGSITSIKSNDLRLFDCYAAWDRIRTLSNPLYKKEILFTIYWSMNFFCTNFLDDFVMYSKQYYDDNKEFFEDNAYIQLAIKNKEFLDFANLPQIPKIIHFCWFGNGPKNDLICRCMESWRKYAPDFEIMEWTEENCDIHENKYVEKAYEEKKWAFVSDYFRLKALYEFGGIYLDTDMELMKPIEPYLYSRAFFAFETPIFVHAGIMGAVKNNDIIYSIMRTYEEEEFCIGKMNMPLPIPRRITEILEKNTNLVKNGRTQSLDHGIKVYSANMMTMNFHDGKCVANHHYEGNWLKTDKESTANFGYEVMRHYFTWDLLQAKPVVINTPINQELTNVVPSDFDYKVLYEQIVNSASWKITKPIRNLFDVIKRVLGK